MPAAPPKLVAGPYRAPLAPVGTVLADAVDGPVTVAGHGPPPFRWPWRRHGRSGRRPILCGDLLAAVRSESVAAVCAAWRLSPDTVRRWRRAFGVPPVTAGAKAAMGNKGSPRPGNGSAGAAAAMLAARGGRPGHRAVWDAADESLLGVLPDPKAAAATGRTVRAVAERRRAQGVPAVSRGPHRSDATRRGWEARRAADVRYHVAPGKLGATEAMSGLTRRRVAERAGVSVAVLYRAVAGLATDWPAARVMAVAGALGVGADDLLAVPGFRRRA